MKHPCLFIFCSVLLCFSVVANTDTFVGADGVSVGDYDHLENLAKSGIRFYGIEQLRWAMIEPAPPVEGKHVYSWRVIDSVIGKIEAVDGRAHITLVCASPWATTLKTSGRVASPPLAEHWSDYGQFVRAVVERYDNDGYQDMPGLKHAHLFYQIEDEAENNTSWAGSAEDYLKLLRVAYKSAKLASPGAKILTFSLNLGDLFDFSHNASIETRINPLLNPRLAEIMSSKVEFTKTVLNAADAYDVVALQYNYHYTGLPGLIGFIKGLSSKPIWVADAASAPLLGRHQLASSEFSSNRFPDRTESRLSSGLAHPEVEENRELKEWWELEKGRTTLKKIVTAASLGIEYIFIQFIMDSKAEVTAADKMGVHAWGFTGLLEDTGGIRPVCHAIRYYVEKLSGYSRVEDLSRRVGPAHQWIHHYRFYRQDGLRDVIWTDGEARSLAMSGATTGTIPMGELGQTGNQVPAENGQIVVNRTPIIVDR